MMFHLVGRNIKNVGSVTPPALEVPFTRGVTRNEGEIQGGIHSFSCICKEVEPRFFVRLQCASGYEEFILCLSRV